MVFGLLGCLFNYAIMYILYQFKLSFVLFPNNARKHFDILLCIDDNSFKMASRNSKDKANTSHLFIENLLCFSAFYAELKILHNSSFYPNNL